MSLLDRVAPTVLDESAISRVKSWLSAKPAASSSGFTAKRNRGGNRQPQTHAQPSPADPKAITKPTHPASAAASDRETKVTPAAGPQRLSATTTKVAPAHHVEPAHPAHPEAGASLAARHKPGSLQHTVHLFRQAKEIRQHIGRPVHVVQHGPKRYITTRPTSQHKILHTYESLREAIHRFRAFLVEDAVPHISHVGSLQPHHYQAAVVAAAHHFHREGGQNRSPDEQRRSLEKHTGTSFHPAEWQKHHATMVNQGHVSKWGHATSKGHQTYGHLFNTAFGGKPKTEAVTAGSVGQTIAGGIAPAGATSTANVGMRTDHDDPFFGLRGLDAIEKERKKRKKLGTSQKAWEVQAPIGGVALIRRSGPAAP